MFSPADVSYIQFSNTGYLFETKNQAFLTTGHLTESKSVQLVILKWGVENRDKVSQGESGMWAVL